MNEQLLPIKKLHHWTHSRSHLTEPSVPSSTKVINIIHALKGDLDMKFSRLGAFTLGVVITAVSVGAVSFVNAAGNGTLKACADKKTGVMRYLAKGKCKKTETSLSWGQIGPQGLPGTPGASGTAGAKGEMGMSGPNFFAVDANGKTVGQILGAYSGTYTILIGEKIWNAMKTRYSLGGFTDYGISYYSDSLCTRPFITPSKGDAINTKDTYVDNSRGDSALYKAYSPTGSLLSWTDRDVYNYNPERTPGPACQQLTSGEKISNSSSLDLFDMVQIEKPTYTPPLRLVAR
jgi:hypothetical protein